MGDRPITDKEWREYDIVGSARAVRGPLTPYRGRVM